MSLHLFKSSRLTADGLVKAGRGVIHRITLNATGTVTAGMITVYDSVTGSGNIIYQAQAATTVTNSSVELDVVFKNGVYVDFDNTVANIAVTVLYL
jgi:hypothetical protein